MAHAPATLAIYLLGPPRLERNGQEVEVDTRKAIALLAYLALHPERLSRDQLAAFLWSEYDQERAYANLRRTLWSLNKAIGEGWIAADNLSLHLRQQAGLWIDVVEFQRLLTQCASHGHRSDEVCPACLESLAQVVNLVRGDFLEGFSLRDSAEFDNWQFFQSEGLRHEFTGALEGLVQGYTAQGEYVAALTYARRWLALDPLHEPVHCHLMQLYTQNGQRAAALRQYEECVRILAEELDAAPAAETTAVYTRIRYMQADQLQLVATPTAHHNLPARTTPFVGRTQAVADVTALLANPELHLITLVGPGGSGKSRLALEVAATQHDRFRHGVYFVALAPLESPTLLAPTVAKALQFSFYAGDEPAQQLFNYLREKELLLVLDNCEHLLAGMDWVGGLLAVAPGLKILATSRTRLNVQAEQLYPLGGIDFPTAAMPTAVDSSAVQLFVQSAQRVQPTFGLSPANASAVAHICRLVQGMPLAILLAAAWVNLLTSAEIANEISRDLDFLATSVRDLPPRHQSLRALFDHSWRLLSTREQTIFPQLSIFRGGFTRPAAQAVAAASLPDLLALANKSLLQRTPSGRFELHELLRQYAAEKLALAPALLDTTRDRHSAYYALFLHEQEPALQGSRQQSAIAAIEAEIENVQMAWQWVADRGQVAQLAQAMASLGTFYDWRGRYQEGENAFRHAAERLDGQTGWDVMRLRARLLVWQSIFCRDARTVPLLHKSLALLELPGLADQDMRQERAAALVKLGDHSTSPDEAQTFYTQSLAFYQQLDDRSGAARVLHAMGAVALRTGAHQAAHQQYEASLALYRQLDDQRGIGEAIMGLGLVALDQDQLAEAEHFLRASFALIQTTGRRIDLAHALNNVGITHFMRGNFSAAHTLVAESIALFDELGFRRPAVSANALFSHINLHQGAYDQADALGRSSLRLAQEIGDKNSIALALWSLGMGALWREKYDEAEPLLQESVTSLQQLNNGMWVAVLTILAVVHCKQGKIAPAQQQITQALQAAVEFNSITALAFVLPGMALLLADRGETKRAHALYALVRADTDFVANSRWFAAVIGQQIMATAALPAPASHSHGHLQALWAAARELVAEFTQ